MEIRINTQSSIKFIDDKIIYFDPFKINDKYNDADIIFITHDHYDHYDLESINNVIKDDTIVVIPEGINNNFKNVIYVKPNNSYNVLGINFITTYAYNINKSYHLKEKEYVGYIIYLDKKYYIMGDTDIVPEIDNIDADYVFIPIGGTYTCDINEAIDYIEKIKPNEVTPIHYGSIVGDIKLGKDFKERIKDIKVNLFIGGEENDKY